MSSLGSAVILRVYLVLVSSEEDRSRAFATTALSGMLSIIIGPGFPVSTLSFTPSLVIQLIFSSISYPGLQIIPGLRFHLYSAPIWLATITNIFSVFFIYYALEEMPQKEKKIKGTSVLCSFQRESLEKDEFDYSMEAVKKRVKKIRALDVSWYLVVLCLIEKLVMSLSPATLGTWVQLGKRVEEGLQGWITYLYGYFRLEWGEDRPHYLDNNGRRRYTVNLRSRPIYGH